MRVRKALGLAAFSLALGTAPASANHPQPGLDISKMDYAPIGHFKPGQLVPRHDTGCEEVMNPLKRGRIFNPSGKWNAFDNNVFEVICLPFRAPSDESDTDPFGNGGEPRPGFCRQPSDPEQRPGNPALMPGVCPNHQLEYAAYYGDTMREILGDFGGSIRQYFFEVPETVENPPLGNTLGGRAINTAAVVPGADHPEQTVVVGAHYDQTNDGPASAWDSQEGHAEVLRVAKLMADYWRATGTRPSATVKFIPWDGEESGTLGSRNYVENSLIPGAGEGSEVRGYWNTDPCAGGYPAFRYGNPADRIDLGIQLADPADAGEYDPERIKAFNARAPKLVEQVFERLDDTVPTSAGPREVFVATSEAQPPLKPADIGTDVQIGTDQPVLFSSDWRNFIGRGIPFFNPGPDATGPNSGPGGASVGNPDGIVILHTPNDNLVTLNRMTGDPTGLSHSEGWAKGMEMCSHLLAWGMLQHDQGGAQATNRDVVAYYEALPNEAFRHEPVKFDASGSYQYAASGSRERVSEDDLEFRWDFGDGSGPAYGKVVQHAYTGIGVFQSKLTVENVKTGAKDTMSLPITVENSSLQPGPQFPRGAPKPRCARGAAFVSARVRARGRGLGFDFQRAADHVVTADVVQATAGRRVLPRPRVVRRFKVSEPFAWNGALRRGRLADGIYEARVTARVRRTVDARRFVFER
ncbi:MAG: M28 family peptidase, partial [Gemmatimonadota bacterium]|nr:M28 family peptidase [Gemmatimonadota bacterium]